MFNNGHVTALRELVEDLSSLNASRCDRQRECFAKEHVVRLAPVRDLIRKITRSVCHAAIPIAANNCATSHQLMAMFGWDSIWMAEQYTRRADQQQLAADAMHLIEARDAKP
jgi:hypothetical protein